MGRGLGGQGRWVPEQEEGDQGRGQNWQEAERQTSE